MQTQNPSQHKRKSSAPGVNAVEPRVAAERTVNEYMICPVCGGDLAMLKPPCKLICFRCGYLASCSMD